MKSSILKYLILPLADKAMSTQIFKYYSLIKSLNGEDREKIVRWQNDKLKELIYHAYNYTQYYNHLFNTLKIKPDEIKIKNDLEKIPILTKDIIRNNHKTIISKDLHSLKYKRTATGGSTGNPLKYLLDNRSWSYSTANTTYYWEKTGYSYGDPYLALGSTSLFVEKKKSFKHLIYYKLKNKIVFNGVNMSEEAISECIKLIRKKRIKYIYGYASAIYLLAKYALEKNISLQINACFPTSEVLTDNYRNIIQKAFNCIIMDSYGAHDGGITAFEVKHGFYEVGYNSIVRLSEVNEEGVSEILITDLFNYAMPLINYKIGDSFLIDHRKNKNHPYNGQVINKIYGRTSDLIQLENGRTLTGPGFTILFKDLNVEAYQIKKIGPLELLCLIKTDKNYSSADENRILSTFKKQAGADCKINIKHVDSFKLSPSGKKSYFMVD